MSEPEAAAAAVGLVGTFVAFWAVIDPIGTVPVFIAVTRRLPAREARAAAVRAVLVASGVLLGFVVVGELVLDAVGVPLPAFRVAGGIVLFLFALTMIFGDSKPEQELGQLEGARDRRPGSDPAIYPLAIPSIASPGAIMAAVVLTDNSRFALGRQALTAVVMLLVLAITLGFLLVAPRIHARLGEAGASLVSRVMGLILASVAVTAVLEGIAVYYGLNQA